MDGRIDHGAWRRAGFRRAAAREWSASGLFSGDEAGAEAAASWRTAGFGPDEATAWFAALVQTPDEAHAWSRAGFDAHEARRWRLADGRLSPGVWHEFREAVSWDPSEARRWKTAGVPPREAHEWWRDDVASDVAARWQEAGFGPSWYRQYQAVGDPDVALEACREGLEPALARDRAWGTAGFGEAEGVGWRRAGFTLNEARVWRDAAFGPVDSSILRVLGPVEHALAARSAGRLSKIVAAAWRSAGFEVTAAARWVGVGMGPAEAAAWKQLGLAPDSAARIAAHFDDAQDAAPWMDGRFKLEDACAWADAGAPDPQTALECRAAGFGPDGYDAWAQARARRTSNHQSGAA